MHEHMELSQASHEDSEKFESYITIIHRLDAFLDSIVMDTPDIITDEIHDALLRIKNDFVGFVNDLKPEQR